VTRIRALLPAALTLLALAAPAADAASGPGVVTYRLSARTTIASVDVFAPSLGVALPDESVVLTGTDRGAGVTLVKLRADGTLVPTFGARGISHLTVPYDSQRIGAFPEQVLRRPDGRLLLAYDGPAASKYEQPHLIVAGLTANGRLDTSFGSGGFADAGVQQGCGGGCAPAALLSDGALLLTGAVGETSPAIEQDPNAPSHYRWVVAKLTPAGALDPAFGTAGLATLGTGDAHGTSLSVSPDGSIAALGYAGTRQLLARITASGAPVSSFNGGAPLQVTGSMWSPTVRARDGGGVDILLSAQGAARLRRYGPSGQVDPAFGAGGDLVLEVGSMTGPTALTAMPDGATVVSAAENIEPLAGAYVLRLSRVSANGHIVLSRRVTLPFGGGLASVFARLRPVTLTPLAQSGFREGTPIARPDGTLLVPGGIGVIQYTGEGEGFMHEEGAAAVLSSGFALDPSFGGPRTPASIAIRVPAQRAAIDTSTNVLRIAVDATTSSPGLAILEARAGKRVIAHSTAPVLRAGHQRLRALLTWSGRPYLRRAHGVHVTVTAQFRDLVGEQASATARGTLR